MRTVDSKQQVVSALDRIIKKDKEIYHVFASELIDTGYMTQTEIQNIQRGVPKLEDVNINVLYWLYNAVYKYSKDKLDPPEKYFEEKEIKDAESFKIKRVNAAFPLELEILRKPDPYHEDYLMSLPIKLINSMQENGLIQLKSEVQRESVITTYNNQLVSHISFDPDKSRQIAENIKNHKQRSDMIRFLLILDGEEDYEIKGNKLIIRAGNIAEIDGNHRTKGSEQALIDDPDNEFEYVVMFSIDKITGGQYIIDQTEERSPINKDHKKTLSTSSESKIVKKIIASDDIDESYVFRTTKDQIKNGSGFVLESTLIDAVKKYYDVSNISRNQEDKTAKWVVEFLNELADIFIADFKNFKEVKRIRWNVAYETFSGYIYLSSVLFDKANLKGISDWKTKLRNILSAIDFNIEKRPWKDLSRNTEKVIEQTFKGVVDNVLG